MFTSDVRLWFHARQDNCDFFAVERNYCKYICGAYIRALCHILVGNQLLAKVAAAVRREVFVWNYRHLDASV